MKKYLLIALAVMLVGCHGYENNELTYQLAKDQASVALILGDSYETNLYNVSQPITVQFKAPKDHTMIIGDKFYDSYQIKINPQQAINLSFKVKEIKNDKNEPYYVETHVTTYKQIVHPSNRLPLKEQSGKYTNTVGEKIYYSLQNNPKTIVVETHEYNINLKHNFYYIGGSKPTIIKIMAPPETVFMFDNGTKNKQYNITLSPHQESYLYMNLYNEKNGAKYDRYYKFTRTDSE